MDITDYTERIYILLYVFVLLRYTIYEDELKHNLISPHCNFLSSLPSTNQLSFVSQARIKNTFPLYLLMICSADITCRGVFWVKRKSISASQQKSAAAAAATAESSCPAKPRSKRSKADLRSARSHGESPH